MLRRVALVRTEVSEERSTSIIRMTRLGELGTILAVTRNRRTLRRNTSSPILVSLMMEVLHSSETFLIRAKRRIIPQDGILPLGQFASFSNYYISSFLANNVTHVFPATQDVTPFSLVEIINILGEHTTSIFRLQPPCILPQRLRQNLDT
jgi:hypothetical protein